ncbi:MAG: hypothetical protein FWE84_04975 [Firmicutes bacterium]|nr:hypothetical protein [Bacillota bacterium]
MVIIKTVDGFGRAAKSAFFDVAECMGCVADNDTVFIVFKDGEVAAAFHKKIGFLRS